MPHDIRICAAKPHDALGILEVFIFAWESANPKIHGDLSGREVLEMYSQESIREKQRIIQELPENEFILVGRVGGRVVSFLRGRIEVDYNCIIGLFVLPAYQRRGIGTQMWAAAMERFDMEKSVVVDVSVTNEMAFAFYTKLGFTNGRPTPAERRTGANEARLLFDWHPKKRDILM